MQEFFSLVSKTVHEWREEYEKVVIVERERKKLEKLVQRNKNWGNYIFGLKPANENLAYDKQVRPDFYSCKSLIGRSRVHAASTRDSGLSLNVFLFALLVE